MDEPILPNKSYSLSVPFANYEKEPSFKLRLKAREVAVRLEKRQLFTVWFN